MNRLRKLSIYALPLMLMGSMSCTDDDFYISDEDLGIERPNDGDLPAFANTVPAWNGEKADDASSDVVGSSNKIYYENNTFPNNITVTYNGENATIECSNSNIICHTSGAYVTIDMITNGISGNTAITLTGNSANGGLKIYGSNKVKLLLDGIELTSGHGPAINNQCKKALFVHLTDGTTNKLSDCITYTEDDYYTSGASSLSEDRKGCFFSEGYMIFSGKGILTVAAKYRHGIVTDSYLYTRPGVTIAVTETAKNAIHAKGDTDDGLGVNIDGGLIYANVPSAAGKGIKTDLNVDICGGKVLINTTGDSGYDAETNDTSSPTGIKSDGNININGGVIEIRSSGSGGKGLNANGTITIAGGNSTIVTTGIKYIYTEELTSSPKGVKADGNINITGGTLNVAVTGKHDGSEGLESKSSLNVSGGEAYVYAYDDAINISSDINISEGRIYAYSSNNDGIDANGTITVNDGLVIGIGASAPESGIDVDTGEQLLLNGGTTIVMGGTLQSSPSAASRQRSIICNDIPVSKDQNIAILGISSTPIVTFSCPRSMSSTTFLFNSPGITTGTNYTVSAGGSLSNYSDNWNCWYSGGNWSGGNTIDTF